MTFRLSTDGPRTAMLLAAGEGRRMMPLTADCPKPLLKVGGQAMLDRSLDRLQEVGVEKVIVNACYLGDQIAAHLAPRQQPVVEIIHEKTPLETGGGVKGALPLLGADGFFVINGDSLWVDGIKNTLQRVAAAWDDATMDVLLLMQPLARVFGSVQRGDYMMSPDGRLTRRAERQVAGFCYIGVSILHPRLFADCPAGAFSLNVLYDRAEAAGRLFGIAHDGLWYHVSRPEDLAHANGMFARGHEPETPYF
ncbi:MAG: mannose-1-phosphate guanylyltransferase [Nisaea sp.]|nr:mannose-1-phosphate guanylyltransferase [Nisaea sp.]OUX98677.1 MAG: mannose-1-phosphate guanylyltransferase [Candidatus Endolissoclinum sp. TMED26]|tara:strand:- start:236 stop:988 length:753 start_codon:yes stop_codon:yes gene_type:complete